MESKLLPLIFYPDSAQSVCRFDSNHPSRQAIVLALSTLQIKDGEILNISLTESELSIVLPDRLLSHIESIDLPSQHPIRKETGWSLFRVDNPPDVCLLFPSSPFADESGC